MNRVPDGVWYEEPGQGDWHYNRYNYEDYIVIMKPSGKRKKWMYMYTDHATGAETGYTEFPDEVKTLEEMKSYAMLIWRMS